jgi:hypothetical protein
VQAISLDIPRLRTTVAGDRYSIHGNGGLGEIDYDDPALAGDVPFWPGTRRHAGHVSEGHLCWGHLDHAEQDGHLSGEHLLHGHLQPEVMLTFVTPYYYLGHYKIAIRTLDSAGKYSGSSPATVAYTINSSPRPACDLVPVGYDQANDQIQFEFSLSPDLVS